MDELEYTLAQIEQLVLDPDAQAVLNMARDYQKQLDNDFILESDVEVMLDTLNSAWAEHDFDGRQMRVSGTIHAEDGSDIEYEPLSDDTKTVLSDYPFVSRGFYVRKYLEEVDGQVYVRHQILHKGAIALDPKDKYFSDVCSIPLGSNIELDRNDVTPGKSAAWLETYHSKVKTILDEVVATTENEAEAVLLLRDMPIPLETLVKKDIREQKKHINSYLRHRLVFEQYLPYQTQMKGTIRVFQPELKQYIDVEIEDGETPILLSGVIPSMKPNSKTSRMDFWLQALMIGSGKEEGALIKVPLDAIISMKSGRSIYGIQQ